MCYCKYTEYLFQCFKKEKEEGKGETEVRSKKRTMDRIDLKTIASADASTEPRATALLLFYLLLLFQLPFLFLPRPDILRNAFSEKRKASRFPLGMAKYEIVRRCSHRRKTSVGYWGRDYPTYIYTQANAHVRVRVLPIFVSRYRGVLVEFRSMKL